MAPRPPARNLELSRGACPLSAPFCTRCAVRWAAVRGGGCRSGAFSGVDFGRLHGVHRRYMRQAARLAARLAARRAELSPLGRLALAGCVVRWLGLFGCLAAGVGAREALAAVFVVERRRARLDFDPCQSHV